MHNSFSMVLYMCVLGWKGWKLQRNISKLICLMRIMCSFQLTEGIIIHKVHFLINWKHFLYYNNFYNIYIYLFYSCCSVHWFLVTITPWYVFFLNTRKVIYVYICWIDNYWLSYWLIFRHILILDSLTWNLETLTTEFDNISRCVL